MKNYEESFIELILDKHKDVLGIGTFNSRDIDIIPLRGGSSNINYKVSLKGKSFFFKHNLHIVDDSYYKDNLEREFDITSFLNIEYQLAPKPIVLDKENRILISEFISGKAPQTTDIDFSTTLALVGNSLKFLREVPVSLLKRLYTGTRICPKNFFQQVVVPTKAILATDLLKDGSPFLFQFLEEISVIISDKLKYEPKSDCDIDWNLFEENPKDFPHGLLHNDLALRNIIITGNKNRPICFIDWEYADFGDIGYDLAYFQSENMILPEQIKIITSLGNINPYLKERTSRYIKIFLPMLELTNAYWAVNHISKMISIDQDKKVKLRPPYSISENLNFIRNKLRRLVRLSHLQDEIDANKEIELFNEMQYALKIFESQLIFE